MPEHNSERRMARIGDLRRQLAERLEALATEVSGSKMLFVDGAAFVPYFDISDEDLELHWDDGLHMTAMGYRLFGDRLAHRIAAWVEVAGR